MASQLRRMFSMAGVAAATAALGISAVPGTVSPATAAPSGSAAAGRFTQTNLVSDIAGVARVTDPNLVNPWGMSEFPGGPLWVSDNGTGVSTLYSGDQKGSALQPVPLVVSIPGGAPTGQVFNPTKGFMVRAGGSSGTAAFIFASESGDITGWNPNVPPGGPGGFSTQAEIGAHVAGAVYKGLAVMRSKAGNFLLAANFHAGTIDVFNGRWDRVIEPGAFTDKTLPKGYGPFNVEVLDGRVYVTYAKQDPQRHDDVAGPGLGFIDVYSTSGSLMHRLASHGPLNSPWGLALAPTGWGGLGGALLVGNFGDGRINAFDPMSGKSLGTLTNSDGNPVTINGLWGLEFGNSAAGTPSTLFFAAGIGDEGHGLLGSLAPAG